MTREIADDLTAPRRVAHVDCIFKVKMLGNGREIIGVVIHIMTVGRLR